MGLSELNNSPEFHYDCNRQFLAGERINNQALWEDYTIGKQTYHQLSQRHGVSVRTIKRRLDKVEVKQAFHKPRNSVVLIDTTYFGRDFGVMVFKSTEGYHLYWRFVKY